jgi:hypothetical protein
VAAVSLPACLPPQPLCELPKLTLFELGELPRPESADAILKIGGGCHCCIWERSGPELPAMTCPVSQLFILAPNGHAIVYKDYRGELPKDTSETFFHELADKVSRVQRGRAWRVWRGSDCATPGGGCPVAQPSRALTLPPVTYYHRVVWHHRRARPTALPSSPSR